MRIEPFLLQATVAAGPRKDQDSDRQLGEDVASVMQTDSCAVFCLCDGTSGEGIFLSLSTRRLAQDFAAEFASAAVQTRVTAGLLQHTTEHVVEGWNHHFTDVWQKMTPEHRRQVLDGLPLDHEGRPFQTFSLVFVGGVFLYSERILHLATVGDCQSWLYPMVGLPTAIPPSRGRVFFRVVCDNDSAPRLEAPQRLRETPVVPYRDVFGFVCFSDGAGDFSELNHVLCSEEESIAAIIPKLRSLRIRTSDDRAMVTGYFPVLSATRDGSDTSLPEKCEALENPGPSFSPTVLNRIFGLFRRNDLQAERTEAEADSRGPQ